MCKRTMVYLSWVNLKEAESGFDFTLCFRRSLSVFTSCAVCCGDPCALIGSMWGQKAADPVAAKEEQSRERGHLKVPLNS